MLNFANKVVKNYSFKQLLGQGAFGKVFLAQQESTGEMVAVKVIEIERFQENDGIVGELVQAEIDGMKKVKSKHVIRYIDSFQDNDYSYLVMEYCDSGDLEAQLKDPKFKLTERDALGIIKQILQGLKDMHEKFIIHRDLKMPNILIHRKSVYKIADLGFCKLLEDAMDQTKLQLGTPNTMAPEVLQKQPYGLLSDLYSVGVILYFILYRKYPFLLNSQNPSFTAKLNFPLNNAIKVSDITKDLLKRMLEFDPKKRITFVELSVHEAFEKQLFSQISRIQIQSDQIDLSLNQQFYANQTSEINDKIQQEQRQQTRLKTKLQTQMEQRLPTRLNTLNENQGLKSQLQQDPIQIDESDKIWQGLQNSSFIERANKKCKLDKIISSNTEQINRVYYFSNTAIEILKIQFQIPLILALLIHNIQFMNNLIVAQIKKEIKEHEFDQAVKEDVSDLCSQLNELVCLQETIKYQLDESEFLLKKSGELLIENLKTKQGNAENLFRDELCKQINQYLQKKINQVNMVVYHLIQCGKYCLGIESEVENAQLEQCFDLKNSLKLVDNQEAIRSEFNNLLDNIKY